MKLVWFRRDLRIADNLALLQACESGEPVMAVYYETPEQWRSHHLAYIQADLICRRLKFLADELHQLNIPLLVKSVPTYTDIVQSLAILCQQYEITEIYCTQDYEFDELRRDHAIAGALSLTGVKFHALDQKCIFAPFRLLNPVLDSVFVPQGLFFDEAYGFYPGQVLIGPAKVFSNVQWLSGVKPVLSRKCKFRVVVEEVRR